MAIQVFPTPIQVYGYSLLLTTANIQYRGNITLNPGLYTVTPNNAGTVNISFITPSGTVLVSGSGSSAFVLNVTDVCSSFIATGSTGGGTVSVVYTAKRLSPIAGTVSTLTNSGTWNTLGQGWMTIVGGGGGGGGTIVNPNNQQGCFGGGSGGVRSEAGVAINTATSYTIGAAGAAGVSSANSNLVNNGGAGGATTFGNFTSNGGGGGGTIASGINGAAGTPGGSAAKNTQDTTAPTASTAGSFSWVVSGTTGAGGIGWNGGNQVQPGGGSGIGTGGTGSRATSGAFVNATAATGYGAGGGGASAWTNVVGNATSGTAGVIYIQVVPNS